MWEWCVEITARVIVAIPLPAAIQRLPLSRYDRHSAWMQWGAMALRSGDRRLKTLPGLETRPTPSRVREAIANIWQQRLPGCRWLDLCAGSGAMAAEMLARGAAFALCIERAGAACQLIRENLRDVTGDDRRFAVRRGDVRKVLPSLTLPPFHLVYFDPPYASDLYEPVLHQLAALAYQDAPLLYPDVEIAVEHDRRRELPAEIAGRLLARDRRCYGQTAITFYRRVAPEVSHGETTSGST